MITWDYLAGFLDGEGTLTYARSKTKKGNLMMVPTLLLFQSSREVLEEIVNFLGQGTILNDSRAYNMFRYQLNGAVRLRPILAELEPRLIIKRLQCTNLLSFIDCRIPQRGYSSQYDDHCLALNEEMYSLNKKPGKTPAKLKTFNDQKAASNLFSRGYT